MNDTTPPTRGAAGPLPRQAGRAKPLLLVVLLAAALGIGLWAWKSRGGTDGAAAQADKAASGAAPGGMARRFGGASRVQPVSVVAVRQQDIRVTVPAIGTLSAGNTAVVRSKVDGELKAVHFTEGQTVKAGQLLAELDPRTFQADLAQAQGQLARDQAQLQNAKVDLERYRDLLTKEAIAKQQVDTQEALVRQLQGTVQSDMAQVENAKLQLSYTRITAPIPGRAGLKQVDLGNMVHASDTGGLVTIAQMQPMNLVFAVPEGNLPQINARLQSGAPLRVEAWDGAQKNRLAEGKVTSTDNAIDLTTGTIKLKAQFPNADGQLFPNQFVNVKLQLDVVQGSLAVPSAAVLRGSQGTYVYVVNPDNSVAMRRIRAGVNDGDWVAVQGDLAVGDKVVTDGADRLRDGAKVEVIAPAEKLRSLAEEAGAARRRGGGASAPRGAASGAAGSGAMAASAPRHGGASAAMPASAAAEDASPQDRPAWLDRLPPDVAEKVMKMSPEERREWIRKRREERARREGGSPPAQ